MKKSTKSFTASELFMDTSGYFSLLVRSDEHHEDAVRHFHEAATQRQLFFTTDYVLSETATLLIARRQNQLVETLFDSVFNSAACRVEWMTPDRFQQVRAFLRRHKDKAWSFTDCFSFHVMRQLKLRRALTKDHHFEQAGFTPLLA